MSEFSISRLKRAFSFYSSRALKGDLRPIFNGFKLWRDISSSNVDVSAEPLHLQIEVTEKCNLRCSFCSHTSMPGPHRDMPLEDFDQLLSSFASLRSLDLTGIGEIFMHRQHTKLFERLQRGSFQVRFNDNATLLTEERCKLLINSPLKHLYVSMDAGRAETFEEVRKGAKFDEVVDNVKRFLSMRKNLGRTNPELWFIFVVHKENEKELEAFFELAVTLGVDGIQVQNMLEPGADNSDRIIELAVEASLEARLQKLSQHAREKSIEVKIPSFQRKHVGCRLPWYQLFVLADGTVLPCCLYSQRAERDDLKKKWSCGNINDQPLEKIWHGDAMRTVREQLAANEYEGPCKGCPLPEGLFVL